jgi:class 3 adenylate cyclase
MTTSVTATFVFTDLVDSTATAARLGPDVADELRQVHFRLLRGAVASSGGVEVKNLGDGLMVMYASPSGALMGAVGMQQAIERHNRSSSEPLGIRVGIATGEATEEDGDYFGDRVVEAARLCAAADGGQILATDLVRLMVGRHAAQSFIEVGALRLKGLPDPVEAVEVRWVPLDPSEGRAPLPARLVAARSANFVGRGDERARLADAWKTVVGGERRLVLLAGEPGIGKTTLAAQFASDAYDQSTLVVYGRSHEDLGVPYQPWIEALGQLVAVASEPVLTAHVAARGAHLGRVVPQLAQRLAVEVPSGGDADAERFVLYGCVTDLLARLSAEQPVLIVLDDLHWADRATVQLLRHVAGADQPMRLGVIATFRDSDVGTDHPVSELLAALHRDGGAERITLHGLSDLDLLALLETIAGHEMDEQGVALRDALLAETAGNPFFVAEILRHLAETGAIYQRDDGRWVADAELRSVGLPISVREVIGRRIATLGPDSERVLALASVIGRDFDIRLLAAIANVDEDTLIDLCDSAVAAAVLATTERPDWYAFAHALIEHTLYDSLSPTRRARAHNTIADTLETLLGEDPGERTAELAYHCAAAVQPTDTGKAVHYAQLAGNRALGQLAPDEAVRWYRQALELLNRAAHPDDRQRAELLVGLGDAQRQCGVAEYRETLLEAARLADELDDVDLLVRAVLTNNRGYTSSVGDTDHERIEAIDRALERVGNTPTAERAKLLALAATERAYLSDLNARLALAEQAVEVARASGDQAALAFALDRPTGEAIAHPSTLARRRAWMDEACDIADRLDDPVAQYWCHVDVQEIALERADGTAIDANLHRAEEIEARIPHATIRWNLTFHQAWVAGLRGDLAEYERLAEVALNFGVESGQPDAFTIYAAQLVNIRDHQGRMHELAPLIEEALAETPSLHAFRAGLAAAHAHGGNISQAKAIVEEEQAAGFPMPADSAWSTGLALWINAVVLVGAIDAVPLLRERILAYHDQIVTTFATFQPALSHYLALLDHATGSYENAERWFTEAIELHERVRSPILVAYTQDAWAALLADRNQGDDHDRARAMAEQALNAAITGGYGYIETDARAILDRLT